MIHLIFVLLSLSCVSAASHTPAEACVLHVQNHTFDLSALRNNASDYSLSDGVHEYALNFCGALVAPPHGVSACGGGNVGVCQTWDKGAAGISAGSAEHATLLRE